MYADEWIDGDRYICIHILHVYIYSNHGIYIYMYIK